MKRELALEFARVIEAAALVLYKWWEEVIKLGCWSGSSRCHEDYLNRIAIDGEIIEKEKLMGSYAVYR